MALTSCKPLPFPLSYQGRLNTCIFSGCPGSVKGPRPRGRRMVSHDPESLCHLSSSFLPLGKTWLILFSSLLFVSPPSISFPPFRSHLSAKRQAAVGPGWPLQASLGFYSIEGQIRWWRSLGPKKWQEASCICVEIGWDGCLATRHGLFHLPRAPLKEVAFCCCCCCCCCCTLHACVGNLMCAMLS